MECMRGACPGTYLNVFLQNVFQLVKLFGTPEQRIALYILSPPTGGVVEVGGGGSGGVDVCGEGEICDDGDGDGEGDGDGGVTHPTDEECGEGEICGEGEGEGELDGELHMRCIFIVL